DVFVTRIDDTTNGQDRVSLDYTQISLTTRGQNTDGSLTDPTTVSWNRETNAEPVFIPNPVVPTTGPNSAPNGSPAQTYYLTVDGIAGDSKAVGHIGAFALQDFDLNIVNPFTLSAGGGAGAGKATFSPLTIDLKLGSGLAALLKDDVTGHEISSLELQGVSADGRTVYDLKLGNVFVSKLQDANNGQDALSFSYQQISVTTTAEDLTGALGNSSTMSWNLATNSETVSIGTPVVPNGQPTGGAAQAYFLTVDGIVGGSQATGHVGAFDIAGFNFDVTNAVNLATGTGGTASKPNFSPLTIDLSQSPSLAALIKDDIIGHTLRSIELTGIATGGGKVYDLKLGDVTVSEVHDTNSGHDVLSFSFDQFSLTTTGQNPDGSQGATSTVSWNLGNDTQNVNIPTPVPSP